MKKNILYGIIIVLLMVLASGTTYVIMKNKEDKGKDTTQEKAKENKKVEDNGNSKEEAIDYSNQIISNNWCTQKNDDEYSNFGNCLMFEENSILYGEPGTDAISDSVTFSKIIRISNNEYELYGTDGYKLNKNDEADYKYNIVWKIRYNEEDNTIVILEGKRTRQNTNQSESVKYTNNTLYKRNVNKEFYGN